MREVLLDYGPVLLVPAAWISVSAAHFQTVFGRYELLVAHVVMTSLMILFLASGWNKFDSDVLKIWRKLITFGIPATVAGILGLSVLNNLEFLKAASIYYWMTAPGVALYLTGKQESIFDRAYALAGFSTFLGAIIYSIPYFSDVPRLLMVMVSMVAVASGQTFSITIAAYQNRNNL